MDEKAFKERTKKLAVAIIKKIDKLPRSLAGDAIGRQVIRSGTSIGANYRAACRAKSTPDMINKMKIVEEEADETEYWLELLRGSGACPRRTNQNHLQRNRRNPSHDRRLPQNSP